MSRRILKIVGVVTGVFLLLLSFVFPVKRPMAWMDVVTGATKHQTQWVFGLEFSPTIEPSALSNWLVREEGGVQYDWRNVEGTSKTIWGQSVSFGHGRAPPIYHFPADLLQQFVEGSSPDEIRRFIRIMREGSKAKQEAAVDSAAAAMLAATDGR